jgi:hypothetical protein
MQFVLKPYVKISFCKLTSAVRLTVRENSSKLEFLSFCWLDIRTESNESMYNVTVRGWMHHRNVKLFRTATTILLLPAVLLMQLASSAINCGLTLDSVCLYLCVRVCVCVAELQHDVVYIQYTLRVGTGRCFPCPVAPPMLYCESKYSCSCYSEGIFVVIASLEIAWKERCENK